MLEAIQAAASRSLPMPAHSLVFSVLLRTTRITLALALSIGGAAAAKADLWRATYSVSLLGFPIGMAGANGEIRPNSYHIEANAKLTGLATLLSKARGAAIGSGEIVGGRILSETYAVTAANSRMTRTMRMRIADSAVTGVDISPPFEDRPDRVPLRDSDKHGVVDPIGAFVVTVPAGDPLVGPAACNRTVPVFDGYTRFDVRLAYVGERRVKARGYSGPVAVCAVRYVPIAGHRPDRPATKFMADNKDIELWLAPVQSARVLLPYRVSVMTMIGATVIEATEFSVQAEP
jgi:hypothetical protein